MNDLKAIEVTRYTLLGVSGKFPFDGGNCFSVIADDGNEYRIINFVYENLEHLLAAGLTWPIGIRALTESVAVFHDSRIPDDCYPSRFCDVCCPKALLPLPQTLRHERNVMQGIREEHDGYVTMYIGATPNGVVAPN